MFKVKAKRISFNVSNPRQRLSAINLLMFAILVQLYE